MKENKFIFTKMSFRVSILFLPFILLMAVITKDYDSMFFPICFIAINIIIFFIVDLIILFIKTSINQTEKLNMDMFNKKKVKELEQIIYRLNHEIEGYQKNERHWNSQIDGLEKISSNLTEENQKLIKWIMNILDTFGTMEIRDRERVSIPIYHDKNYRAYDNNFMGICERERITIPEITIVKMG